MDLLILEGSPRERGRIHGEALRPLILDHIGHWKEVLGQTTGDSPDTYIRQFLDETDMLTPAERWTPELLEEVRGIAEGSGVGEDDAGVGVTHHDLAGDGVDDAAQQDLATRVRLIACPTGVHCSARSIAHA